MNLTPHVDTLRQELLIAAEAGGEETRVLAERLIGPLQSATRLILLEVLSDAANEITRELAPGSVDLRIRGREPEFVVTSPVSSPPSEDGDEANFEPASNASATPQGDADDGGTSRMTLRLPEHLKLRIEQAAERDGLSVNAWLVRAIGGVLEPGDRARRSRRSSSGGERYTGWVH